MEQYEHLTGIRRYLFELQGVNRMDIAYELGGLFAGIAILLIALAYGGWRPGWFSGQRTDAGNLQAQARDGQRGRGGQQDRGWRAGAHSRPDDITRGV